jgi:hypothetical protein
MGHGITCDCLPAHRVDASPWRVQFYRCGYEAVSGWPGWRAVVTSAGGDKAWVDLPTPGPDAFLHDYATAGSPDELCWCLFLQAL